MAKKLTKQQVYEHERAAQNEWARRDLKPEKLLEETYKESIKRMQDKIDQFYIKYAKNSSLTRAEANKRIKNFDVQAWANKAAKAVKDKDFSPYTNEWLKLYNSKMSISRIELMKAELELELQSLYASEHKIMDKHLIQEAKEEYKRQAGILGGSATGSAKRIRSIVNADFYGNNFSSVIWGRTGHYAETRKAVFGSLNRIYTDMMGYKKERSRLMKDFDVSANEAMRLLRTETARVRADAELESYRENGATHYIYTAESGACSDCADLDGMAIPIEEAEKGLTMFPLHPNCRCSSYGHIEMKYKDGRSTLDEFKRWESKGSEDDGIMRLKEPTHLHDRFDYVIDGKKEFIPKGTEFTNVVTIAGKGGERKLRVAENLSKEFGGNPKDWKKKVGKIESDLYIFDIHWYELDGKSDQFKVKLKYRGDKQ